jgi:hypothetical protein
VSSIGDRRRWRQLAKEALGASKASLRRMKLLKEQQLVFSSFVFLSEMVEDVGIEPTTSGLQSRRSPS